MPEKSDFETFLLSGQKVYKDDERVEACGVLDELSSLLGVAKSFLDEEDNISKILTEIQGHLFMIGAQISGLGAERGIPRLGEKAIQFLEDIRGKYEPRLPKLKSFIYPGGCKAAAFLHLARAVARRAERRAIALSRRFEVDPLVVRYLNRLSTILFILARYVNLREGVGESTWIRS